MSDCFRFLINVDQCLNMSNFDMFFYKLQSQHKLHLNQVQLFGDMPGATLRHAAMDIREYINRYSHYTGTYIDSFQIIVAMRSVYDHSPSKWKDTMLYRMLQLHYELQRASIFVTSQARTERVVNLIMLYDTDFDAKLPQLDNYMSGPRFYRDCRLMLTEFGLNGSETDMEALRTALKEYGERPGSDAARDIFSRFCTECEEIDHVDDSGDEPQTTIDYFMSFLIKELANYQVFELLVDRNNEQDKVLAMLRVVQFVNAGTDVPISVEEGIKTLSARCLEGWDRIREDETLEESYARMLFQYKDGLQSAANDLARAHSQSSGARPLPQQKLPGERAISISEGMFADSRNESDTLPLEEHLIAFERSIRPGRGLSEAWESAYNAMKVSLDRMENELREYASKLSFSYTEALAERKRDTAVWGTERFVAGADIARSISAVNYDRENLLNRLKTPLMEGSMSFQDQLNMENSLDQHGQSIRFNIQCLRSISIANFLLPFLLVILPFVLHYFLLQPYVFTDGELLLYTLIYLVTAAVLLLLCCRLPTRFFLRRIRQNVESLKEDLGKYIRGYFDKAVSFRDYINLLNQLDYITRYARLLRRTSSEAGVLEQSLMWHKLQLERHLKKLQFFSGLIETYFGNKQISSTERRPLPPDFGEKEEDVVDCPIYWPQG